MSYSAEPQPGPRRWFLLQVRRGRRLGRGHGDAAGVDGGRDWRQPVAARCELALL